MAPFAVVKVQAVALGRDLLQLAASAAQGELQASIVLMGLLHVMPALMTGAQVPLSQVS